MNGFATSFSSEFIILPRRSVADTARHSKGKQPPSKITAPMPKYFRFRNSCFFSGSHITGKPNREPKPVVDIRLNSESKPDSTIILADGRNSSITFIHGQGHARNEFSIRNLIKWPSINMAGNNSIRLINGHAKTACAII